MWEMKEKRTKVSTMDKPKLAPLPIESIIAHAFEFVKTQISKNAGNVLKSCKNAI
jgi:hypothetical protein